MDRAFKGVWIPDYIWLNEELTIMEKVFLVEITSLDGEKGCFANNKHFERYSRLSKTRCSGIINSLKEKGYVRVNIVYKDDYKTVEKRIIRVDENRKVIEQKRIEAIEKEAMEKSIRDKEVRKSEAKDNALLNNKNGNENKSYEDRKIEYINNPKQAEGEAYDVKVLDNKKIKDKVCDKVVGCAVASDKPMYNLVIDYLNNVCGSKYLSKSPKNQKLVNARVREGYSFDDFKMVIDKKFDEWSCSEMRKYLRPETLFGSKFERYVNEIDMNLKSSLIGAYNNGLCDSGGNTGFNGKSIGNNEFCNNRFGNNGVFSNGFNENRLSWMAGNNKNNNINGGKGGQTYGKQFKNVRGYREDKTSGKGTVPSNLLQGCNSTSRYLSEEDREWAERELF